ncbi:ribosomal protein L11 methyltransferase [Siminovitchia terrae]|uniref:Ribosomal protein L11 methyltransferase n=1 Tax=Siminovitchia terrae TaxID=1914933 RepID=A0A429XDG3_SIMTE|nr:50S ribosomal protein L11 methyltransferase [Siminovitchia terrae]RST61495.1 50S ribosomal protein L11 methyltransferase [Siminovitchia terrae]GIN89673.1 ribosomal protein L11 methyltransferase [Siminovitchia terrae]GIN96301.1 ribosomal protein L11 methyltransferase [Siminovitchia terrae]
MNWTEISILTANEAVEPISHILYEAGISGLVIEDRADFLRVRENRFGEIYELDPDDFPEEGVIIKAYLAKTSNLNEALDEIKENIANLKKFNIDIGENKIGLSDVKEEDWATAWKKYYHPVNVSDRFTIVPTWEDYTPSDNELIIELDPGMAFGTGTHPTTVMCIQALEKTVKKGDTIIDVGTGSGVLSIAAALLSAKEVKALDLDEVAVEAARQNISLNRVAETVTVEKNDLLNGITKQADIIVANILAEVIISFADEAAKAVKKGGFFITSGIIEQKCEEVKAVLQEAGFTIEETIRMEDWAAFIARR